MKQKKRAIYRRRDTALRRWLEDHEMTQESLRARLGISQVHMTRLVNGYHRPGVELAFRIRVMTGLNLLEEHDGTSD